LTKHFTWCPSYKQNQTVKRPANLHRPGFGSPFFTSQRSGQLTDRPTNGPRFEPPTSGLLVDSCYFRCLKNYV